MRCVSVEKPRAGVSFLDEAGHPAVAVFYRAGLNTHEFLTQALGDLTEPFGGCGNLKISGFELSDGGDDCCGAAGSHLCNIAGGHAVTPLVQGDGAFLNGHSAVFGQLQN